MNVDKGKLVKEIERKWLVELHSLPPKSGAYPYKEFMAGWFEGKKGSIRIRKEGRQYFKVKKFGSGLVRDLGPGDIKITKTKFDKLWPKTKGRRLWKRRYFIPYRNLVLELDVYHDFKNLYTVEVEFKTVAEAKKFKPLKWFGREVTDDGAYTSNSLATNGLPKGRPNGRRI